MDRNIPSVNLLILNEFQVVNYKSSNIEQIKAPEQPSAETPVKAGKKIRQT